MPDFNPLLPSPTFSTILSLLASFSLVFFLWVLLRPLSTLFSHGSFSFSPPDSPPSRGSTQKGKMFTFNFTFHVPNPFSMTTLTSVANAATDAFNSVATDIREDPELLNYMVAGLGPGGVAGGFGYDPNRLVKSPPSSSTPRSSHTSPKSKGPKSPQNRHAVGLGLANPHAQNRRRYLPNHERNRASDFQSRGSTSGFVLVNPPPPGSGTPEFPTQASYSQYSSYLDSVMHRPGQGVPVNTRFLHPLPESRKRGWVPPSSEPSYASTNEDFTTGFFDTPKYSDVNEMGGVSSSIPAFGLDGRGSSRVVSGVGDRRKRDEGNDGEDAMDDAGEYLFPFIQVLRHCFHFALSSPGRLIHRLPFVRSLSLRQQDAHVQSAGNGTQKDHFVLYESVTDLNPLPFFSPCMARNRRLAPRPHPTSQSPLLPSYISFSVWASELLTGLISFLFCVCLFLIYLPLIMLYRSRFRFGVDALFSVELELPPAKRRKGLAGSILSTALSAALIGTAVGLTVYRL